MPVIPLGRQSLRPPWAIYCRDPVPNQKALKTRSAVGRLNGSRRPPSGMTTWVRSSWPTCEREPTSTGCPLTTCSVLCAHTCEYRAQTYTHKCNKKIKNSGLVWPYNGPCITPYTQQGRSWERWHAPVIPAHRKQEARGSRVLRQPGQHRATIPENTQHKTC